MAPKEKKDITEQLLNENLEILSTDTVTFRVMMLKKMIQVEQTMGQMGCVGNSDVVEKHEKEFKKLSESASAMDKKVDLLKQAVETGNKAIVSALGELKSEKEVNKKAITEIEKDIIEMKTEKKTMFIVAGVIFSNMLAVIGLIVALYVALKPDTEINRDVPRYHSQSNENMVTSNPFELVKKAK